MSLVEMNLMFRFYQYMWNPNFTEHDSTLDTILSDDFKLILTRYNPSYQHETLDKAATILYLNTISSGVTIFRALNLHLCRSLDLSFFYTHNNITHPVYAVYQYHYKVQQDKLSCVHINYNESVYNDVIPRGPGIRIYGQKKNMIKKYEQKI